jgi:hypothetical protein
LLEPERSARKALFEPECMKRRGRLRCVVMGEGGPHNAPTAEEFEQARRRELARLNVRVSSITGEASYTTEDLELLEGDTAHKRSLDMDVVRRWTANSERYGGGGRKLA